MSKLKSILLLCALAGGATLVPAVQPAHRHRRARRAAMTARRPARRRTSTGRCARPRRRRRRNRTAKRSAATRPGRVRPGRARQVTLRGRRHPADPARAGIHVQQIAIGHGIEDAGHAGQRGDAELARHDGAMGQIAAGLHDQRAGAQEQRRPGRIGGRSHQHGPGRHGQPGGRIARHEGGAARMAGRHRRAAPAVGAGIDSGIRAARRRDRPARRRRFPPPRPDLPRPPIVAAVSCATRRAGPPLPAARRRPGPAIPRRSGGTHRRARPNRRGRRSVRQRQRAAPGGGDIADQHAARGLALAAVQPRAGDRSRASGRFQRGSAAFSVRQAASAAASWRARSAAGSAPIRFNTLSSR